MPAKYLGEWTALRKDLLQAVATLYSHSAVSDLRVVIKSHPVNLLNFDVVHAVWPETPVIIVVRKPLEVMLSMLTKPGGFMAFHKDPVLAARIFGWTETEVRRMGREEFSARVIGHYIAAALDGARGARSGILDYENINRGTIYRIAELFNLEMPEATSDSINRILATYSKDPMQAQIFSKCQDDKQQALTATIREMASKWTAKEYDSVRRSEHWWLAR
jgi:hypothetical protein